MSRSVEEKEKGGECMVSTWGAAACLGFGLDQILIFFPNAAIKVSNCCSASTEGIFDSPVYLGSFTIYLINEAGALFLIHITFKTN
jgi:hypothetical protein